MNSRVRMEQGHLNCACFSISCFLFSIKTFMFCFCRPDFCHTQSLGSWMQSHNFWDFISLFNLSYKLLFSSEASLLKELSRTNQHQMVIQLAVAGAKLDRRNKAIIALSATTWEIFKDIMNVVDVLKVGYLTWSIFNLR